MKISVTIITRNRREDLKQTLENYLNQTYRNKEIIVVDNGSDDGTREMMSSDFPYIDYTWLPDNFDIRALNIAFSRSTGDIIWRTDDDSYPETPDTFERVAEIFKNNDDIDIIASEDIEVKDDYAVWDWYPFSIDKTQIPEKGFQSNTFTGTGAGIRRVVFETVGGFWEFGFEELDLCTRAILAGFKVRYFPNIRTLHFSSKRNRITAERWVKLNKQLVRYQWKYMPVHKAFINSCSYFLMALAEAVYKGIPVTAFFEGVFSMLSSGFMAYRSERTPVPKSMMYDVTLGTSAVKSQLIYLRTFLTKRLFKKK